MNVLLAGPDHEENLSLRYLSGSLMAHGHETLLATFNSPVDRAAVVNAAQWADLAGLSLCFQARAGEFLALARGLKENYPRLPIVAGGHYASCAAEDLLGRHPEIDVVVVHEGERTLVEIAGAFPRWQERLPEIAGIAYRDGSTVRFTAPRTAVEDLDSLPLPDRRGPVHWIAGVPTSYLMGSRGCYGDCAYCCITTLHRMAPGKRFRQRSVESIAGEMATLYRERGTRQFIFHDDNFLVPSEEKNHARIAALEAALRQRRVKDIALAIKCRPLEMRREVLLRLKSLGLIRVFLGVESASERGLAVLNRHQSVRDSERALSLCAELGISAQFTLMTFHPDTTLETLRADIAFMRRFSDNPLNFCRTEIYTGTPLEKRMIEAGRAIGDYRGRAYRIADEAADLVCQTSMRVFHDRCWDGSALMQCAIGLDHSAAVLRRFYDRPAQRQLAKQVQDWVGRVNRDTIDLLAEVVEGRIRGIEERERRSRLALLKEALDLTRAVQACRMPASSGWGRLARPAAAALLVMTLPVTEVPLVAGQVPPAVAVKAAGALSGRIVDPTGAVIPNAQVTITNESASVKRSVRTDEKGHYEVTNLPPGRYTIRVEVAGFKAAVRSGIVLQEGKAENIDVGVTLEVGCCEVVAIEIAKVLAADRRKPFVYVVGQEKDEGTLRGVAKVVYHDRARWIEIFEANRDKVTGPGAILPGTSILIPERRQEIPQVGAMVRPVYPPEAKKHKVKGEVAIDVVVERDGTVSEVKVIEGEPLLAEAAASAVKQWRYRTDGQTVHRFAVVVKFGRNVR